MMFYEIENLKLNYEIIGEGQQVLIFHGLAGHLNTMKTVFEPIFEQKTGYERIYIDLPGMGKSNAPLAFASSDEILKVLLNFIQEIIHQSFLLIGYSYGGYLARAVTVRKPDIVKGLMLLAPMVIPSRSARNLPEVVWYKKFEEKSSQDYMKSGWIEANEDFLAALDRQYAVSFNIDKLAKERQFSGPTLTLIGHQDSEVGYEDQLQLLGDYPRSSLAVLDLAGHNLQIEQPHLLKALTKNWLERCHHEE